MSCAGGLEDCGTPGWKDGWKEEAARRHHLVNATSNLLLFSDLFEDLTQNHSKPI